jgi:hypothetical protein
MVRLEHINDGSPFGFTNNFLTLKESATAVLIFRHKGLPYVLSAPCEKYMGGDPFKIIDPARHRRNMGNHGPASSAAGPVQQSIL